MRLKFLFFPIMLVISAAIFIGFVWPQFGAIKKANEEGIAKNAELQAIKEKQLAIESVGKKISDNAETENIVKGYLPENKTEERIINGVNYLASAASVSLLNISLSSEEGASAVTPVLAGVAPASPVIDPITGLPVPNNANSLQKMSAKISISGDYDKIRIFLDSLQRMPMFNTVNVVDITKSQGETVEGQAPSSALSAEIEVDFGYLSVAKVDSGQVEKFQDVLDNETITSLKGYISQKSQMEVNGGGTKGKSNPFSN